MAADVLVINLTRFGDLLQSQAVIDDLHAAGYHVNLLCLDNFSAALPLLRNVRRSWRLPGARLLSLISANWPLALATLEKFALDIRKEAPPDAILNLTPTLPARLLTRLLAVPGTKVAGFGMDALGYGINYGVWASFFAVAAAKRANSPFNLADMMRRLAAPLGAVPSGDFRLNPPDAEAMAWADAWLAEQAAAFGQPISGFVALQLGASQDMRRWPVASFRELGRLLWHKTGLAPVLLGSPSEADLGARFGAGCDYPFINAIGKTDLGQLAAILQRARLLVTNDTGTMHLAAGLGRPLLALFLATAQPVDTGPLNQGSCSLEPNLDCHPCAFDRPCERDYACRKQIAAATAADYCLAFLEQGDFARAQPQGEARAWLTTRNGLTALVPLSDSARSRVWPEWLRRFWGPLLAAMEDSGSGGQDGNGYAGLPAPEDAARLADKFGQAARLLAITAETGAGAVKQGALAKIFLRNCERAQAFMDSEPALATLAAFWRELKLNQGGDLEKFAAQAGVMARHVDSLAQALSGAQILQKSH